MRGREGVKVEGFIVVAIIWHICHILPPALVGERNACSQPSLSLSIKVTSQHAWPPPTTRPLPSPPWPISDYNQHLGWESWLYLTPMSAWQTRNTFTNSFGLLSSLMYSIQSKESFVMFSMNVTFSTNVMFSTYVMFSTNVLLLSCVLFKVVLLPKGMRTHFCLRLPMKSWRPMRAKTLRQNTVRIITSDSFFTDWISAPTIVFKPKWERRQGGTGVGVGHRKMINAC